MSKFFIRILLLFLFAIISTNGVFAQEPKNYERVPGIPGKNNCDAGLFDPNEDDWSCADNQTIKHTWQSWPFGRFLGKEKQETFSCPVYKAYQSICLTYDDPNSVSFPGGNGVCAACFIPKVNCASLDRFACETSAQQCFWYSGGKDESPHCVKNNGNMNDSSTCRDGGHCYKGQTCAPGNYCTTDKNTDKDTKSSSTWNKCENYDNNDSAFKCFSSPCGISTDPWSESTSNSGAYSCSGSNYGPYCCKNPVVYARRILSKEQSPSGGSNTGTTPTPSGGTPGPTSGPCAGVKGGVLQYVNGTCNEKLFDPTKAANREFCGGVYKDKYICNNIDPTTNERYVDYVPIGGDTCSKAPWCPSTKTTSTPTPGAASNCSDSNYGNWGVGCPCPTGGGCSMNLACYPEATGKTFPPNNPNGYFCAPVGSRWCAKSQTTSDEAACRLSTPYISPTPTPSEEDKGYLADCPWYNSTGGYNECLEGTKCPDGYTHAPTGPGGTNGDKVCSETNGRQNVCCTKISGGTGGNTTTTPPPSGGTNTPPATTTTPPQSTYTPPSNCVGHPAYSMCGKATDANKQCFYPGGTGYWAWKGEGNGCDTSSGTQTHCFVCSP